MRARQGQLFARTGVRHARQLAAHQPCGAGGAGRRQPGRHGGAANESDPGAGLAGERVMNPIEMDAAVRDPGLRRTEERNPELRSRVADEYRWGFVTDIEQETVPKGLSEDVIRLISAKKNEPEFMLEWRLQAYRHWLTMREPTWSSVHHPPIDYQDIHYYAAPKPRGQPKDASEIDPELLRTYEKLGIPLQEREALAGVAVDAVFDSVSVATTFKDKLESLGIIFCSFSEAVQKHPDLVRQYLGSVVPYTDNYFATLNSAVFTDGSFVYVPKGVRCPMELSTYFRINARNSGQFERTLIIA